MHDAKSQTPSQRNSAVVAARLPLASALASAVPAVLLALACADASALIRVSVHADFPTSGFAEGPVYGTVGPQSFDVEFNVDETAATHYASGFEVRPGSVILGHDVYAIDYGAIQQGSPFNFGTQAFSGMSLHNLSFALLDGGVIAAPMFLSDITPGSTPYIEVGIAPHFAGLGSYDFSPFVPGTRQTVFLTNQAQMFDGTASAFGTVSVHVAAIPEPTTTMLLLLGLLPLTLLHLGRRQTRFSSGDHHHASRRATMSNLHIGGLVCLISALATVSPSALAYTHDFHLSARLASGTYSQDSNAFSAVIGLTDDDNASGLLPPITVSTGDTVSATIHFDQALHVPASMADPQPYAAYFGFRLGEFDPAQVQGGTTVFATLGLRFFDGSTEVQPGPAPSPESGCGNVFCMGSVVVAATQAMQFDRVELTAHIDGLVLFPGQDLGQVATVVSPGEFSVYVLTPVPEPASAGMLLAGLLGVGWWTLRHGTRSAAGPSRSSTARRSICARS